MKPEFNLDIEMNSILQSDNVKIASKNMNKKASSDDDVSSYIATFAELAFVLEARGMSKTASSLREAAASLIKKSDVESVKVGQLYGLI